MKKILIFCFSINVLIISIFSYFLFFKQDNNEVSKMIDVVDLNKYFVVNILEDYELEFIYEQSEKDKNVVIRTEPSADELTQIGQKIKIFVSTGESVFTYKNLINTYYDDNIEYLNELESKNISVIVESQVSDEYPNGVIIHQSSYGEITEFDVFKVVVNYTKPLIQILDFTGKTENYVLDYFKDYDIKINFIYNKNDGSKLIYDQSIAPNSLVISGIVIYIYISI